MNENKKIKKTRGRSPSYPGIDIKLAVQRARELYEKDRHVPINIKTAFNHLGYKFGTGVGNIAIAALKKYGLLTEEGSGIDRMVCLTDSAIKIIKDKREFSAERNQLILKAALTPKIHESLYNKYGNGKLPSDENLMYQLEVNRNFTENGAREFISQFKKTLAFVNSLNFAIAPSSDGDSGEQGEKVKPPIITPPADGFHTPPPPPQKGGTMKNIEIPTAFDPWPVLTVRFPMSEEMWNQMINMLETMKPALVKSGGGG